MALSAKLQMRQSQSLVLTPQLLQSIRLLQLTNVELERFVEEEIERNPLLERPDTREDDGPADETSRSGDAAEVDEWFAGDAGASADSISDQFDTSIENLFPDEPGRGEALAPDLSAQWKSAATSSGAAAAEGYGIEDYAAQPVTLRDHVGEQIAFGFADPAERLIAADLADALDEAGYARVDTSEIAFRLGAAPALVEAVLARCQGFDPPGIFARDLAECLSIQLAALDRLDPAMRRLVDNLELLARRDFAQLKRICAVDEEDLLEMLAEIRALDPRPGQAFAGGTADPVVPDILVRPAGDGGWSVELNHDALPRVLVDQAYFARVNRGVSDDAERAFLAECLQSANWLVRSLDQRARTILKVASEIVRQQDAFLMEGISALRPLNLRTVADAIGMHESTVSRVTSNKFMMTPRGLFELRFFFSVAIASAGGGDAHSSESVRHRIRQMIEAEEPADVLSDDAIVDSLNRAGIDIARRTVAKYREGMGIPSSVQRRREKRARATLATAGR
jgi:RNA polymerase sigma-54 factor